LGLSTAENSVSDIAVFAGKTPVRIASAMALKRLLNLNF
jgi:hypothetical protein